MTDQKVAKHGKPRNNWFLKYAQAEHFGELSQRTLGPFGPHLNVVYGSNEAGKTSFVNLISGVMFGWEDGRSAKNTYKPANAERCGSLTFEKESCWRPGTNDQDGEGAVPGEARGDAPNKDDIAQISRAKNAEGLKGDTWLLEDIERETYRETFNLNSEKLMSMNDVSNVTSRILTATSGTSQAPTKVREEIDRQIAEFTSKSAKIPHSIVRLQAQQLEMQERINALLGEEQALMRDSERLGQLTQKLKRDQEEFAAVSTRVEKLGSAAEVMRPVDERRRELSMDRELQEKRQLPQFRTEDFSDVPTGLLLITNKQDEAMRQRVKDLHAALAHRKAELDQAENDFDAIEEDYLKGKHDDEQLVLAQRTAKQARRQAIFYGVTVALFVVLGIVFSLISSGQASMGMSAITVGFLSCAVVFAALLAVRIASLVKAKREAGTSVRSGRLARSRKRTLESGRADLKAAQARYRDGKTRVREELDALGLAKAQGSTSEALFLLDRARNARLQKKLEEQVVEVERDIAYYEVELAKCEAQGRGILEECGIDDVDAFSVERALNDAIARRQELADAIEEENREIGRLEQRLSTAGDNQELDALRMELQQVKTRIKENMGKLAQALIAKRLIDEAIRQWERTSQPQVIAYAERVLNELTHGSWTHIHISSAGEVEVSDRYGTRRPTRLLSTATCQQVYISLRIAMLETATFVGRNVPVMCDDVLVHFDWSRRAETARFLAELSQTRQVIMFTCHEEVAELLARVDSEITRINL